MLLGEATLSLSVWPSLLVGGGGVGGSSLKGN